MQCAGRFSPALPKTKKFNCEIIVERHAIASHSPAKRIIARLGEKIAQEKTHVSEFRNAEPVAARSRRGSIDDSFIGATRPRSPLAVSNNVGGRSAPRCRQSVAEYRATVSLSERMDKMTEPFLSLSLSSVRAVRRASNSSTERENIIHLF